MQPPGGMAGRVLEEAAGVAAARLGLEAALVVVGDAGAQLGCVAGPEGELGPEHAAAGHEAAGEGAAAVDEAELGGFDDVLAVGASEDGDALEDVAEAAAVGPGVVDDGAADRAGDAAGPLEAREAFEGELA